MKVERKIALAFVVAFLAISLVGVGAYLNTRELLAANNLVVHTYDTLAKTSDLLGSIQGANNGALGFFLTGEPAYLVPYSDGLEAIGQELDDLRRLTADNPMQQRNIDQLQGESNRLIAYLHRRVEVRRNGGLQAVLPQLGLEGKEIVDQIRFRAATIRNAELQLLKRRDEAASLNARQSLTALLLLLLLAMILVVAFYRFIRRDLAGRRRAVEALGDSDKKFRGVLESAPDAMFITSTDGVIQLANTEAGKLFGYSQEELVGSRLASLLQELPPASPPEDTAHHTRLLPTGKRKDNTLFPVELSQSPLALGRERLLIHAVRDRSEQQRAEEALNQSANELKRSNIELERFAYVASHDLQEPLRMVSSYTQLLARRYKDKLDASANEFIDFAVDGANRMQKLINDLLALSRVGTQVLAHETVDCEEVLARVLSDLRPTLDAAGVVVEEHAPLPKVTGDRTQLGQLFQNLVGNAVKFRGEAVPRVTVSAALESERMWRFSFKDNGIGIEPQYFERIFVIFQRLHGKEQYPGTGIGLAICQKVVERHGGKLWVESAPGAGAEFFFTLPSART